MLMHACDGPRLGGCMHAMGLRLAACMLMCQQRHTNITTTFGSYTYPSNVSGVHAWIIFNLFPGGPGRPEKKLPMSNVLIIEQFVHICMRWDRPDSCDMPSACHALTWPLDVERTAQIDHCISNHCRCTVAADLQTKHCRCTVAAAL